jgi:hypothetical protein
MTSGKDGRNKWLIFVEHIVVIKEANADDHQVIT